MISDEFQHRSRLKQKKKPRVEVLIFSFPSLLTCVLGVQKNRLIETALLSCQNICLGWEIRKIFLITVWSVIVAISVNTH